MPLTLRRRVRPETAALTALALTLGLGWASREIAFARERAETLASQTVTLDKVSMAEDRYEGKPVGHKGVYFKGDTPASSKFETGRYAIDPGKSPHPAHTHVEEEVMIVESGSGEIFCDGKTTKVGPGAVMFTTPNAPHAFTNTGTTPMVFYYIKWAEGTGHKPAS